MKKSTLLLFYLIYLISKTFAQSSIPEVTFLQTAPIVDGMLDENLSNLTVHSFSQIDKSSKSNPDIKVTYRIAYTCEYLYVFVEAAAEQICMRDYGYMNGDGICLVLANPKPNHAASDEFYVLGFSPQVKPSQLWQKQVLIYKNGEFGLNTLQNSNFAAKSQNGKTGYELLLSWKDVHPCHP